MSLPADFGKFLRLPGIRRGLLLHSLLLVLFFGAAVRLLPFRWMVRRLRLEQGEGPGEVPERDRKRVEDIRWALGALSSRLPGWGTCLVKALAGAVLLRGGKNPFTLVLGVTKGEKGELEAQAWLKAGEAFVSGSEGHERFTPLSSFSGRGK